MFTLIFSTEIFAQEVTVKAQTYYVNPDTGKTDDGGTGNVAIGEGMCRSVIDKEATLKNKDGKESLVLKVHLMSSIDGLEFAIQKEKGNGIDYKDVSYKLVDENQEEDVAYYEIKNQDFSKYIRCKAFIDAMGRDVCFYIGIEKQDVASKKDSEKINNQKVSTEGVSNSEKGEIDPNENNVKTEEEENTNTLDENNNPEDPSKGSVENQVNNTQKSIDKKEDNQKSTKGNKETKNSKVETKEAEEKNSWIIYVIGFIAGIITVFVLNRMKKNKK